MKPRPSWILDTSVAAAWFLTDEPLRERALQARSDLIAFPERYAVPQLFYSELVHVLTARSLRDRIFVERCLRTCLRFGIRVLPLTETALSHMPALSCKGLGGYDATFVAVAQDAGAKWLTADDKAARIAGSLATRLLSWKAP